MQYDHTFSINDLEQYLLILPYWLIKSSEITKDCQAICPPRQGDTDCKDVSEGVLYPRDCSSPKLYFNLLPGGGLQMLVSFSYRTSIKVLELHL